MEPNNIQKQSDPTRSNITSVIENRLVEITKEFLSTIQTNTEKTKVHQEEDREKQRLSYKKAMIKAMKKMPITVPANKIVEKPNGQKYSYADLSSIIEATKQCLTENGFYVEFRFRTDPIQKTLNTMMLINHEDGWVNQSEPITLKVNMDDPQNVASALTYSKRYLYCSMLNICADTDDDGSAASNRPNDKITDKQNPPSETIKNAPSAQISALKKETTKQPVKNVKNEQKTQSSPNNLIPPEKPQVIKPVNLIQPNKQIYKCADCGKEITENEARYSARTFLKTYCLDCQPKHKPVVQQSKQ